MALELPHFTKMSPAENIIAALKEAGGVVIEGLISQEQVNDLNERFIPVLEEERAAQQDKEHMQGRSDDMKDIMPPQMVFATNLPARFPELAEHFGNPLILEIAAGALETKMEQVTLNTSQVIESHPGAPVQQLHRDDMTWPAPAPRPELCIVTLWALQNFTPEAGGTVIAPGSHKWADAHSPDDFSQGYVPVPRPDRRLPTENEIMRIEMKPGSVLLFMGSLLHGGGANVSGNLVRRYMHLGYCHAWLRQVENQAAVLTPEQVLAFPEKIQRLLGFDEYQFELGHVYNMSPSNFYKMLRDQGGL